MPVLKMFHIKYLLSEGKTDPFHIKHLFHYAGMQGKTKGIFVRNNEKNAQAKKLYLDAKSGYPFAVMIMQGMEWKNLSSCNLWKIAS